KAKKAIKGTKVEKVIVVNRLGKKVRGKKFLNFKEEMDQAETYCKPEIMNSEDAMFILYTSGTTGRPKGVIHDTGGYATQAYWTTKWNFNLHDDDVMWCTADIGWVTGHTYALYGPLLNGATTLIYEGAPDFPNPSRWWRIIKEHKVSVFYTAPTAIRMFMRFGDKHINKYKLDSLRILGTVGEPIDKDAWMWYFKKVGKGRCPVIDTWWQTETGGTLINALPGIGPFVPTISGRSFPGTKHLIVNEKGKEVQKGKSGNLVQVSPFAPGMLHGVYKNHKKYVDTYWKRFKTKYDTSDGAYLENGLIRITGRTDDVMKVAGHRLSTAELENALNNHKKINESAVVPIPHKIKGQVPVAFVVLKGRRKKGSERLIKRLKKHTDKEIGPTARPAKVYFVRDLPKTRSGKIMRRILKSLLAGEKPKGLMTLVNPEICDEIKEQIGEEGKKKK
ncbi:AMP-binding protein, partial [Candidatus Pacearchaeota archaeon]|nr:AMP-binding protein [Candidatus Pacearchaeota archaeon]